MGDIVAGYFGYKGAQEQAKAAKQGQKLTKQMYDQNRSDMLPWLEAGKTSLADLQGELGSTYEASKGYQFQLEEGNKNALSNLAALGMSNSGAALKRLTEFGQGLAAQDYGNWYNRKAGVAGAGQTQSSALGQLGQNYGQNMSNLYNLQGAAKGSGYVALGNGLGNAVNDAFGMFGARTGQGQMGASLSPMNYSAYTSGAGGLY